MKHFTWVAAAAVSVIAVAIYWTNGQLDLAVAPPAEPRVVTWTPIHASAISPRAVATIEIMEPILVLPEWEIAPAPESTDAAFENVVIRIGEMGGLRFSAAAEVAPRPEAGQITRPWMPYAPEDRELSETRRLEWTKLAVLENAPAEFEETAEPPLLKEAKR